MQIDRRRIMAGLAGAVIARPALAANAGASAVTAWRFGFDGLNGGRLNLIDYSGKPVLVVNTASFCGYTPQYATLQQLWVRYHARGLMIIGVPSNDFGGQEPGTPAEITQVTRELGVGFPLAAKSKVVGADAHPFYRWAAHEHPGNVPTWNFHKYLIGRDGGIAAVFGTTVEPNDSRVIQAIVKELPA